MKSYSNLLITKLAVIAAVFLGLGMALMKLVEGGGEGQIGEPLGSLFSSFWEPSSLGGFVMKRSLRPVLEFHEVARNLAKSYGTEALPISNHDELSLLRTAIESIGCPFAGSNSGP